MHIEQLALAAALSLLVGVGLGQIFRIGAVLLVSAVTIVAGIIAACSGGSLVAVAVSALCAVFCLQFGYMVGLVLRSDARRASERRRAKTKNEAVWH